MYINGKEGKDIPYESLHSDQTGANIDSIPRSGHTLGDKSREDFVCFKRKSFWSHGT